MVLFTSVLINGIETKSVVQSWYIEKTSKEIVPVIHIEFTRKVYGLVNLDNGQTITIYVGTSDPATTIHFRGFVERIDRTDPIISVFGRDKFSEAERKEVTEIFDRDISKEAGNVSQIFKNILEQNTNLTANVTSTNITLSKFVCNHHQVFERLEKLRGILDWQMYYDVVTDTVKFEPKGTTIYDTILEVGVNAHRIGRWRFDTHNIVNNLTLIGGFQTFKKTETFTGDGSTTNFQLEFIPFKDVKVDVDGTIQKGGIDEVSTKVDFTVDTAKEQRKIKFKTAPTNSASITIDYNYQVPIVVTGREEESITKYGEYEKTFFFPDVNKVEDARRRHRILITALSTPFIEGDLRLSNVIDVDPGNTVTITDTQNGINNETKIVVKVETRYPSGETAITVGDREIQDFDIITQIKKRIGELERELAGTPEVIIKVKQFLEEIKVSVENFTIQSIGVDPGLVGTAIVGHSAFGKVGTTGSTSDLITTIRRGYTFNKKKDYEEWTKDANIIVQNNRLIMR